MELKNDYSYIIYRKNDVTYINKKHFYWDRIQGHNSMIVKLYLVNLKLYYLVIWTSKQYGQTIITEVEKDPDWFVNLEILEKCFIKKYIPFVIEEYIAIS
ncbi:Hypothetical protein CINCED_3A020172 [Cinara cedri]|uniref:Uncharacterized protein n=1 Tax=Cinara cedri TaxID=506608 RepID=A0A5E4LZD0_9HEMI|nr:Hypothetical protein CINCED_3A020172 [Cinara cedri]